MTAVSEPFVFGLASSLHCAAMCGPLAACCTVGGPASAAVYHGARVAGYVAAGAVAGWIGGALGVEHVLQPHAAVAFVLAAALLLGALGGRRWLAAVPGLGRVTGAAWRTVSRLPGAARGAVLGAITPILPCGLLVGLYGAAAAAGGASQGALTTAAFSLGSMPLLLAAQLQLGWLHGRLGISRGRLLQRAVLVAAAGVLVWRGLAALAGAPCCPAG